MYPVVHDDQDSAAFSLRVNGDTNSVVQIQRTIRAHGSRWAHRTNHNHGLIAFHDKIQKEGSFFHRVRAVRYDYAIHVITGQKLVDALSQLEHDFERHIL